MSVVVKFVKKFFRDIEINSAAKGTENTIINGFVIKNVKWNFIIDSSMR